MPFLSSTVSVNLIPLLGMQPSQYPRFKRKRNLWRFKCYRTDNLTGPNAGGLSDEKF